MKKCVIITGVSGAGKTHLSSLLEEQGFAGLVTFTSREPRSGEQQGIDYHFRSADYFKSEATSGNMFEHAIVNGDHYGIPKAEFVQQLNSAVEGLYIVLDPQGAKTYQDLMQTMPDLRQVTVFINCPLDLRVERVNARLTPESTERQIKEVAKRLIQTKQFESQWEFMVSYEIYIAKSSSQKDAAEAADMIRNCLSLERPKTFHRALSPESHIISPEELSDEIMQIKNRLKGARVHNHGASAPI